VAGSMIRANKMRMAALVMSLGLLAGLPAQAGVDESVEAIKDTISSDAAKEYLDAAKEYLDAAKEAVMPVRKSLEDGICDVVVSTMPGVERSIASIEALLADVYYFGHFVPRDYDTAVKWYHRAGEKGNALAQSALGDIYYYGRGVPQDYKTASQWWEQAANQGVGGAQLNLSVLYANGEGVAKDLVRSHMYANLAAAQLPLGKDYEIAVQNRKYIAEQMTPGQIADAQQQAKAWRLAREQTRRDRNAGDIQTEALDSDAGPKRCRW